MNCNFYSGWSFIGSLVTIEINLCCLKVKVLVAQSCPTLCDPVDICQDPLSMEFSRQGYEWVAIHFSRGSSPPRDRTWVSCTEGRFFTV